MGIKKPLICQAGSAEAFVGSTATGREHIIVYGYRLVGVKELILFSCRLDAPLFKML